MHDGTVISPIIQHCDIFYDVLELASMLFHTSEEPKRHQMVCAGIHLLIFIIFSSMLELHSWVLLLDGFGVNFIRMKRQ